MIFYLDEVLDYNKQKNNQAVLFKKGQSKPLAVGFSDADSIKIGIRNDFSQLNGLMGGVSNIYNSLRQLGVKYSKIGVAATTELEGLASEALNSGLANDETARSVLQGVTGALGTVKNVTSSLDKIVQKYGQRTLDTADAYMSIFNGTGVSVSLEMHQYLISDSVKKDINEDLDTVVSNLMGDYKLQEGSDSAFIGYTAPPHEFETIISALKPGEEPDGTLTLYINDLRFRGLVLEGLSIDRSKTRVITENGDLRPLWIRLDYTFKNVVKYTKEDVKEWLDLN